MKGVQIYVEKGRRIVKGLGYYKKPQVKDLREIVKLSVQKYGEKIAFKYKTKNGDIATKTYVDFDSDIDSLGTALIHLGLEGKPIAIIGENSYDWSVSYYAVVNGTGIVVPLDKYLPQNEVMNLVIRGKIEAIIYSPTYQDMMLEMSKTNNTIKHFICMQDIFTEENGDKFINMPNLIEKGRNLLAQGNRGFVDAKIDREIMSILLFTSGTTSLSKGVMLSHTNVASNVSSMASIIDVGPTDVHLSLLPLHHTFENNVGLSFMVYNGVTIAYCQGIRYVAQNINEFGVTILVAVPAILEAMYKKMQEAIEKSGKAKQLKILMAVSEALRKVGIDVRRTLFKSVFDKLGPNLRLAVSGAAPLDTEVIIGFGKIGLNLIQGYGLTETSPVVAAATDLINVAGWLTQPVDGVEVTIDAPDENGMGEIFARGANVMLGYYEDKAGTKEAIDEDGWFKTGDQGLLNEEGMLKITGRVKSMIVFTNGKKAFPEEYEFLLNNVPGVKSSFSWGNVAPDGDIQVCACVVVDKDKMKMILEGSFEQKSISQYLGKAIKDINIKLPQYKIIRYFLTTEQDIVMTTTLKIKRNVQLEKIENYLKQNGIDMRKANGNSIDI